MTEMWDQPLVPLDLPGCYDLNIVKNSLLFHKAGILLQQAGETKKKKQTNTNY